MNLHTRQRGFSLLDLALIILAFAGIVFVILPVLARPRHTCCRASCSSNLKQVGLAFRIWALDNNDKFPMQVSITNGGAMELAQAGSAYEVFLVMSNELSTPKVLFCSEDWYQNRVIASVFASWNASNTSPTIVSFPATNTLSYFVGLEADETKPNTILSGDDHFSTAGAKPSRGLLSLSTNAPIEWRKERHQKQGNTLWPTARFKSPARQLYANCWPIPAVPPTGWRYHEQPSVETAAESKK